ncbi:agmatine deiminase family protein [Pandoraea pulmonicola]|uniref:Agmatine deiminase n=2 Tax=Pandoraea pulmonicola TaxID=93221 RepID=A0AAJ4ZGB2_PANPU|nr:agmatine deiminase family protein [Pandoraea pulmonicola]AJC22822.1 agmatine deiminase [Pandoraea pulmonicola]SUA92879.1 Agmatine deiminase [Pandoraea pulmonicola]
MRIGLKASVAAWLAGARDHGFADSALSVEGIDHGATGWVMPDEGAPHAATWMAFGPSEDLWGRRLQAAAQDDLARVAKTIGGFEPVNMLVREEDYEIAQSKCGDAVNLIVQPVDDIWMRDTGPVFVRSHGGGDTHAKGGIDFNFNGWGDKQEHGHDAAVARSVAQAAGIRQVSTRLVLEGGALEVDGDGTAILTESCVLNPNRNPGVSKSACEAALRHLLGLRKIIWLPGVMGKDITDGHTDFYARFVRPGVVVVHLDDDTASYDYAVTRRHLDILRQATDAAGRKLQIVVLPAPNSVRVAYESDGFAAGYVNFYVCNGGVIAPQFGDRRTDRNTRDKLRDLFPGREIVQVDIDGIAAAGGGIHCTTQQQPV